MSYPFEPDWTLRPGIQLMEVMRERDLSILQVALRGRIKPATVKKVLGGRKEITGPVAAALERALGVPSSFWLSAQRNYDADLARGARDASDDR